MKAIEDENESLKQQAEIEVESRKESDGERWSVRMENFYFKILDSIYV